MNIYYVQSIAPNILHVRIKKIFFQVVAKYTQHKIHHFTYFLLQFNTIKYIDAVV